MSATTCYGTEVGREFFFPEYEVIRAVFFASAEANNGVPLNFEAICLAAKVTDLKDHLYQGYGFGDDCLALSNYVKDLLKYRSPNSDEQIFRVAIRILEGYGDKWEVRRIELLDSRGEKSFFQRDVRLFINDLFGIEFFSEKQVKSAVGVNEITTKNDEGNLETIKVHHRFSFDMYLELNRALKEYLGLDDKWIGIAVEAMSHYYHSSAFPDQLEADRKKRLICKEMNVVLIEIWDIIKRKNWASEVFRQIEEKAGTRFNKEQLYKLRNYLGDYKDT